ncbi:MAG: asparagine synthase (glutamine-hydrolyzing) [Nitrospinaceae bacterium]|nr:asparagine synthase (glutamine-hydrolyzing) [Nitrospina sp.]MBT5375803.1 asparagine synthase (glutamine-hydrolyzing) [Nitrospinaceae bacterium]MBT6345198.1 asparagine synthase (glutamine-hydrolyzing) [Nitrospina sp.]
MCGLAGFFSETSLNAKAEESLRAMGRSLRHRGPDDEGVWIDSHAGVGLAHQRLSVVDLSVEGRQPMISASGRYVMVYNGEVYNYLELRKKLDQAGEARWRGHSDTEVVLACIEKWGLSKALAQFNGMFAFALWDKVKQVLTLARDRVGVKPLYYGWNGKVFLFGSELKALKAHPEFEGRVDRESLSLLMRFNYIPAPRSIYQNIFKLQPGTFLSIRGANDVLSPTSYWSFRETAQRAVSAGFNETRDEAVDHLDSLLGDAVKLRMNSDVPLGVFLSGGIDSSTIVALMQKQSSQAVKTFSIGFHEESFNEAPHARKIARHLGTDHTELYVSPKEALSVIPQLPNIYDEPLADPSQIPTFLLSKLTRQKVVVSLSGDGGDELFCGYNRYFTPQKLWEKFHWLPKSGLKILAGIIQSLPSSVLDAGGAVMSRWFNRFGRIGSLSERFNRLEMALDIGGPEGFFLQGISHWSRPQPLVLGAHEPNIALNQISQWSDFVHPEMNMMLLDSTHYLPDDILAKVDRASMGVGLEVRVPMLDPSIVEFSWKLPMEMKVHEGESKWILRQVLDKYVPRHLTDRPKMGFGLPIDTWLNGSLKEWAGDLLNETTLRQDGFLDPVPIMQRWKEHRTGRYNWQYFLWNILSFQSWLHSR